MGRPEENPLPDQAPSQGYPVPQSPPPPQGYPNHHDNPLSSPPPPPPTDDNYMIHNNMTTQTTRSYVPDPTEPPTKPQNNPPAAYPPQAQPAFATYPQQAQPVAYPPQAQQPVAFPPQAPTVANGTPGGPQINAYTTNHNCQPQAVNGSYHTGYQPQPQVIPGTPSMFQPAPGTMNTQQWSTGLFDCFDNPENAIMTFCFPCITFGQIAEIVDNGQTSCATSGLIYGLILAFIGLPCIMSCSYRTKIRNRYNLLDTPGPDWVMHFFCEYCALCQEYRELKNRGMDPALGWQGNLSKQQQMANGATMIPPMNQRMMG